MLHDTESRLREQSAEAAKEVASASHHKGEDGGDDGAAAYCRLVGDGIELAYHLRQSPSAERCEHHNSEKTKRCGTKPRGEVACLEVGKQSRLVLKVVGSRHRLSHFCYCLSKSALVM